MIVQPDSGGALNLAVSSATSLFAAFLGAWAAFRIEAARRRQEDTRRKEEETLRDIRSTKIAIFKFLRAHNTFMLVFGQAVDPWVDNSLRHHFIMPMRSDALKKIDIDFGAIGYLLDDQPDLLGELAVCEEQLNTTIDLIHERSRFHQDVLQPAAERVQLAHPELETVEQIAHLVEGEMGTRLTHQLRKSTDELVIGVVTALHASKRGANMLAVAARKRYSGHKFSSVVDDPLPTVSGAGQVTRPVNTRAPGDHGSQTVAGSSPR